MFDVGFPELVLIFVIALLVLGPQRLPKVAAEVGKWVGRARRTAMQLRRQLEREIELNEVIVPPKQPAQPQQPPEEQNPSFHSAETEPTGADQSEPSTEGSVTSEAPSPETPAQAEKTPPG